jgi:hypothetical protein
MLVQNAIELYLFNPTSSRTVQSPCAIELFIYDLVPGFLNSTSLQICKYIQLLPFYLWEPEGKL